MRSFLRRQRVTNTVVLHTLASRHTECITVVKALTTPLLCGWWRLRPAHTPATKPAIFAPQLAVPRLSFGPPTSDHRGFYCSSLPLSSPANVLVQNRCFLFTHSRRCSVIDSREATHGKKHDQEEDSSPSPPASPITIATTATTPPSDTRDNVAQAPFPSNGVGTSSRTAASHHQQHYHADGGGGDVVTPLPSSASCSPLQPTAKRQRRKRAGENERLGGDVEAGVVDVSRPVPVPISAVRSTGSKKSPSMSSSEVVTETTTAGVPTAGEVQKSTRKSRGAKAKKEQENKLGSTTSEAKRERKRKSAMPCDTSASSGAALQEAGGEEAGGKPKTRKRNSSVAKVSSPHVTEASTSPTGNPSTPSSKASCDSSLNTPRRPRAKSRGQVSDSVVEGDKSSMLPSGLDTTTITKGSPSSPSPLSDAPHRSVESTCSPSSSSSHASTTMTTGTVSTSSTAVHVEEKISPDTPKAALPDDDEKVKTGATKEKKEEEMESNRRHVAGRHNATSAASAPVSADGASTTAQYRERRHMRWRQIDRILNTLRLGVGETSTAGSKGWSGVKGGPQQDGIADNKGTGNPHATSSPSSSPSSSSSSSSTSPASLFGPPPVASHAQLVRRPPPRPARAPRCAPDSRASSGTYSKSPGGGNAMRYRFGGASFSERTNRQSPPDHYSRSNAPHYHRGEQ